MSNRVVVAGLAGFALLITGCSGGRGLVAEAPAGTLKADAPNVAMTQVAAAPAASGLPERRNVIALEYSASPTPAEIGQRLADAAKTCWVGRDPGFAGFTFDKLEAKPNGWLSIPIIDSREKDPTRQRAIIVNVGAPASGRGYIVQLVQRGEGLDYFRARIEAAVKDVEYGKPVC